MKKILAGCLIWWSVNLCSVVHVAAADLLPAEAAPRVLQVPPAGNMPVANVDVDARADGGPLELWRHSVGHGGVNSEPLPEPVVAGAAKLRPRLIRIFIQEFFCVYPERGKFDWSRLDPFEGAAG